MSQGERRPLAEALETALAFGALVDQQNVSDRWLIAGSVRRGKPTISDIEIVAVPRIALLDGPRDLLGELGAPTRANLLLNTLDALAATGEITKQVKSDGSLRWGNLYRAIEWRGWVIEVFLADADNFGLQALIRTGSAEFSQEVATRVKRGGQLRIGLGYLRQYYADGLTDKEIRAHKVVPCPEERVVLKAAGLPWIEPRHREIPL